MRTSSFEHIVRLQFNSLMLIVIKNKLKSRTDRLQDVLNVKYCFVK